MPVIGDGDAQQVRVAPSAPLELMWVKHFAEASHEHEGAFASLEPLRRRLGPHLITFWPDGLRQYSTELVVLAHRSDTLLDLDLDRFFDRLPDAMRDKAPVPSLRSESADERRIIADRLTSLRSNRALRSRYAELLHELWDAMATEWKREGRAGAVAEAARWARAIGQGTPFRQLLQAAQLWPGRPELDPIADAAAQDGNVVLNPCWWGGKIHIIELDGLIHVGRGIRHTEAPYKKLAVAISSSIKTLADPTRLAILLRLARSPASVTDIAVHFHLSQPTVSVHIQMLREAGLIEEKAAGRKAMLSASEEGVRRLFASAEQSLIEAFRG